MPRTPISFSLPGAASVLQRQIRELHEFAISDDREPSHMVIVLYPPHSIRSSQDLVRRANGFAVRRRILPFEVRSCLGLCAIVACAVLTQNAVLGAPPKLEFDADIRPILKAHCSHCHGEESELAGGLDVRLRRLVVQGGDSGPAVVAGDPAASLLLQRIVDGEMPPEDAEKRPTQDEIELLRVWVQQGAKTSQDEPETLPLGPWISPAERQFWAFQPILRTPVPEVRATAQVREPVDAFLLARLEEQSRGFSEEIDRPAWLRRVSIDLTGLAPTAEEQAGFLADHRPAAFRRQVDRLLSSPAFGERWGRHWLDVAGYSDSEGRIDDPQRKDAWKYRDFVVRSFNRDLRYDEFIVWQLAGDEIVRPPYPELDGDDLDRLIATGFLRMAADGSASGAKSAEEHNQVIADTMQIVGASLLGLTVQCAQCHNHRYDPIPQQDYYQLRAVFDPAFDWKRWKTPAQRRISLYSAADKQRAATIEEQAKKIDAQRLTEQEAHIQRVLTQQLEKLDEAVRRDVAVAVKVPVKERTPAQQKLLAKHPSVNVTASSLYLYDRKASDALKALAKKAADLRATRPREEFVRALAESSATDGVESYVFVRGDPEQPGDPVEPRGLSIVRGPEFVKNNADLPTSGRRLAYAQWLTSDEHPLTARVAANRIWMHLFGRGLVATPSDFGLLGRRPSHPLLLDFLASELRDSGWQLKPLIRQLVLSTAYRQSTVSTPEHAGDPENRWLGRMTLRRLDAEAVRDLMLQAAGTLNLERGGEPVPVMADLVGQFVIGKENLNAGRPGPVIPMNGQEYRRSIYIESRRSRPLAVLDTFDLPAMAPNCECRETSTVAPQSLLLMNSDFAVQVSQSFADAVIQAAGPDAESQLKLTWRRAYCADADDATVGLLMDRLASLEKAFGANGKPGASTETGGDELRREALATICQALLGSNRFLYIE